MRSKNSARITPDESDHMAWVKVQNCIVCGAPGPCDAHHIEQGSHYTTLPLCGDCHVGSHNGIHGRKAIWKVLHKTELSCLNELIQLLRGERGV